MENLDTTPKVDKSMQSEPIKKMGSDCVYCSLAQGITCMMYFCKKKSRELGKRQICNDGFAGKCPDYKL